jgi:hypothetical protein
MKNLILITSILSAALLFVCVSLYGAGTITQHFDNAGKTMKNNLRKIHDLATGTEHADEYFEEDADGENFDQEYFEHADNYQRRGADAMKAHDMAYSKMRAKYGKPFEKHASKGGNKVHNIKGQPYANTTALFDIVVKRDSANIGLALPVPLFAAVHYAARYRGIINQYLPASVTITNITLNAEGSVVIEYTEGANVDTITIKCVQTPYITFLSASEFNAMQINKFRYRISDTNYQNEQYSQTFETAQKTLFGKFSSDQVSVAAQEKPNDFKNNIVDVDYIIPINYEKGIVVGLIAVARFNITLSCFVQRFNRTNIHSA